MDFASLHIFKTVVDEGGVVPAARKLHRVQSNVTTRIKQLEASLGVALFVRTGRRLVLSPQGRILLDYADRMLRLSQEAQSAVMGEAPAGVLRIGTLESTAASRLPALLSSFHEEHPVVRVELVTDTSDGLIQRVAARDLDAAFAVRDKVIRGLEALPCFEEELVVAAPRSHPPIRNARDVDADTIISFPGGCAYRRHLQSWLASAGVIPQRILELASYHAIVACVASGTGVALIPKSVLERVRTEDALVTYPLPRALRKLVTCLVWRSGEVSPALKALQAMLKAKDEKAKS